MELIYYLNVILFQRELYIYLPVRRVILYQNIMLGIYSSEFIIQLYRIRVDMAQEKDMTIKPCMCMVMRTLLVKSSNSSNTTNRTERGGS